MIKLAQSWQVVPCRAVPSTGDRAPSRPVPSPLPAASRCPHLYRSPMPSTPLIPRSGPGPAHRRSTDHGGTGHGDGGGAAPAAQPYPAGRPQPARRCRPVGHGAAGGRRRAARPAAGDAVAAPSAGPRRNRPPALRVSRTGGRWTSAIRPTPASRNPSSACTQGDAAPSGPGGGRAAGYGRSGLGRDGQRRRALPLPACYFGGAFPGANTSTCPFHVRYSRPASRSAVRARVVSIRGSSVSTCLRVPAVSLPQ